MVEEERAQRFPISIHAPTRGATAYKLEMPYLYVFQSTLPRGERPVPARCTWSMMFISIHAPTRGATLDTGRVSSYITFQSTLPRGERRRSIRSFPRSENFNPRSHEGSDDVPAIVYSVLLHISIHAPTRGATMCYKHLHKFKEISIHAPTRGATKYSILDK